MGYFVIEDFRLGQDGRKHILSMPPGSLYWAKNANITRGGDAESCKAFVPKYTLPANTFGQVTASGKLYVFGSIAAPAMPADVNYQRLQYPDGSSMTGIRCAAVIKGKIFAIATFANGMSACFFDGVLVSDWVSGSVGSGMTSYSDIAAHFAALINTSSGFTATAAGASVQITGPVNDDFTISTMATNGAGGVNDQYAIASVVQASAAPAAETVSKGTVTFSGIASNKHVTSITVNGVEILGANIAPDPSAPNLTNDLASAVAVQINGYVSSPDYTASVVGGVVTISASPGLGTGPNGYAVVVTATGTGTVTPANMAGGVNATTGLPKKVSVNFGGTFEQGDSYSITLNDTTYGSAGASENSAAGEDATFVLPTQGRACAIAGPNLFGSAIDDPTEWNGGTGSFVIDMSSEVAGAEALTSLSPFQGNLAVFSRSTTQIWNIDADPANNKQVQVLSNIGALAPRSVTPFGDADTFFLSDTGLRSLKVRAVTGTAALSDIGSPMDPVIIDAIKAAGDNAANAVSIIEPIEGRFLLQIGTVTYVFSYFPGAKIAAWTTYETGLSITEFSVLNERLYARAGNVIYLYGGDDNDTYSDQAMDVKLPFLSARQIATVKHFTGLDVVCDGTMDVYISTDPNQPLAEDKICTLTKSTIGQGAVPVNGESEAVSLRFVGKGGGEYSRVSTVALHFDALEAA